MKKLITALTILSATLTVANANDVRNATQSDQKRINKFENKEMEKIINRVKLSPMAIVQNDVEQNANVTDTLTSVEIEGQDPSTGENCTVTLTKDKSMGTPMSYHTSEGLIFLDQVEIIFPELTTKLMYGVEIANSTYIKDRSEMGMKYFIEGVESNKKNGVTLTYSDKSPRFLGNQTKTSVLPIENNRVLFSTVQKPFSYPESQFDQKIEPGSASCLINL